MFVGRSLCALRNRYNRRDLPMTLACHPADRWLHRGMLVVLLLACALTMSANTADPDLWGHVQYGRDALRDGLPATTTYSFTAEGYRWINHENLSELIFAVVAGVAGGPGLLVMKCLLGLTLIGLIVRRCQRDRLGMWTVGIATLLVAVNLTHTWSVRPQLFSCVFFAALVALVDHCFDGWAGRWHLPWGRRLARAGEPQPLRVDRRRLRWLWLAPVLFVVWTNTHGAFVAGVCIFTAIMGMRCLEALVALRRDSLPVLVHLAGVTIVSLAVTTINPYGIELHRWLLSSLGVPRPEIREWHPIAWGAQASWPALLLFVCWAAALLRSRRPIDLTHTVVAALVLWQATTHQRHVPFFAVLFGFWTATHLESFLTRGAAAEPSPAGRFARWRRPVFATLLIAATVVLGGRLHQRLRDMPVPRDEFPVDALQFMADNQMHGRLLVTYNWAQYAIAAFAADSAEQTDTPVAFDGRFRTCYPQQVVDMHFDFILGQAGPQYRWRSPESPPPDAGLALRFYRPDVVLLDRRQPHSVAVMQQHADRWTLLYQDHVAQVWGRTNVFGDPAAPRYVAQVDRQFYDRRVGTSVGWPALPTPRRAQHQLADQSTGRPST